MPTELLGSLPGCVGPAPFQENEIHRHAAACLLRMGSKMGATRRIGLSGAVLLLCGRIPSLAQQPQQMLPEVLDEEFGDFRFEDTFMGDQKAFVVLRPDTKETTRYRRVEDQVLDLALPA